MKKKISTYPLRLPASLKAAVADLSKKDGTSINLFVTMAVAEKVSAIKTAEFFTEQGAEADIEAVRRLLRRDGASRRNPYDRLRWACRRWWPQVARGVPSLQTTPEA